MSRKNCYEQFEVTRTSTENKMGNDWKQGLCGCLGEPEVCLCGLCIPCCLVKQNADNLGKGRVTLYDVY